MTKSESKPESKPEWRDILVIKRLFAAPVEQVFDAWTEADVLAEWFGPEGFSVSHSETNLSVGGKYEIDILSPEGKVIKHFGTYLEISRPNKLAFTWMLEDQDCRGSEGQCAETLVSIELKCIEQQTEITLSHEQLPNQAAYDGHEFGWNSSFESLGTYLLSSK